MKYIGCDIESNRSIRYDPKVCMERKTCRDHPSLRDLRSRTEEQVDLPVVWVEQARFYQELLRYRTVLVVATVLATAWRRAGRAGQRNDSLGFPAVLVQYPYQGSDRK